MQKTIIYDTAGLCSYIDLSLVLNTCTEKSRIGLDTFSNMVQHPFIAYPSSQKTILELESLQTPVLHNPHLQLRTEDMANILRKVLSFGNMQKSPAPNMLEDENTLVEIQEPKDEEMEVLPDFAHAGITDHTMILKE